MNLFDIIIILSVVIFILIVILIFIITITKKRQTKDHFESKDEQIKKNILLASQLFSKYEKSTEIPERLAAHKHIDKNDVILEIGGNIGGVSAVIADILKDGSNLVVLEPSIEAL